MSKPNKKNVMVMMYEVSGLVIYDPDGGFCGERISVEEEIKHFHDHVKTGPTDYAEIRKAVIDQIIQNTAAEFIYDPQQPGTKAWKHSTGDTVMVTPYADYKFAF